MSAKTLLADMKRLVEVDKEMADVKRRRQELQDEGTALADSITIRVREFALSGDETDADKATVFANFIRVEQMFEEKAKGMDKQNGVQNTTDEILRQLGRNNPQ